MKKRHEDDDASSSSGSEDGAASSSVAPVVDASVSFASLGVVENIVEATTRLGYKAPTEIQRESIPPALAGRDIIGLAQTGSGKTAAFAIPVLQKLLADSPSRAQRPYACVLAPTRELCFQIAEQFQALGSALGSLSCAPIVGGIDMAAQALVLAKGPHVIVCTPGRLVDHLENTKGFTLRHVKFFVLDEADRLFSMDFEEEIDKVLRVLPRERQTFLFSATMTTKVAKLQRASLSNPVKVEVSSKYSTVESLIQQYVFIPAKYKDVNLVYMLNELAGNTFIVFVHTCSTAQRLALVLRNLGFSAIPLHGQMSQPKRLGALNKFKAGSRSILIATDVAARGLDIPTVDCVINYDLSSNSKDYIHRVGRTARAGRAGRAIAFVTQYDVELFQRIEQLIGKRLTEYPRNEEAVMVLQERVSEAQRFASQEMKEQGFDRKRRGGGRDDDDAGDGGARDEAADASAAIARRHKSGGGGGRGGHQRHGGGGGGGGGRGGGGKRHHH